MKQLPEYKIEKNVPLPKKFGKYTPIFKKMKVGYSINLGRDRKAAQPIISSSYSYGKANKQGFANRKMEDGHYRLWRVK